MIHFVALGEKRAEVKAANPDDKIGDIAKVAACSVVFLISHLYCRKWGKCGRSWMRRRRWIASFSCVNLLLLQAPYEKKAEAAKKKYAEEMAAYEG